MKSLFKYPLTLALLVFFALSVQAQDGNRNTNNNQKADKMTEDMQRDLNLTNDQATRIRTANRNYMERKQALKDNDDMDSAEMDRQMTTLRDNHHKEVRKILNEEQYRKYAENKNFDDDMRKKDNYDKDRRQQSPDMKPEK